MNSPHTANNSSGALSPDAIKLPGWKRTLDIVLILLALPVVLPLMAVIAVVIWIVSPGPVLFRQERVGHLGCRFMCLKFRTMLVGADTTAHQGHLNQLLKSDVPMVKMDAEGDPRVIRFGSILRSTGLDELPQVINVLLGEMSLVGPRPCMPYEYENYLPWQRERFNAVPGLTGLWQVSGKNRTTFVEMIQWDIKYAQTKTLWLDLKIIFKTIPALIVQVRDNRAQKKSLVASVQPKTVVLARTTNHYPMPEPATASPGHSFQPGYLSRKRTGNQATIGGIL